MESGEIWAYRRRAVDELEPVRFIRQRRGTGRKNQYSLVRFESPEADGLEEWIPDGRLKCPWAEADEFLAREERWAIIRDASKAPDDITHAVGMVIDALVTPDVMRDAPADGVYQVRDIKALSALTGLPAEALRENPESFTEDDCLLIPFATSVEVAKRVALSHPDRIIREVEKEESELAAKLTHRKQLGRSVSQQIEEWEAAQRRSSQIRREWLGEDNNWLRQEATAKENEAERLRNLVEWAIRKLDHYGHTSSAATLQRNLDAGSLSSSD